MFYIYTPDLPPWAAPSFHERGPTGINGLGAISKKGAELFKDLPAADKEARKKRWEDMSKGP